MRSIVRRFKTETEEEEVGKPESDIILDTIKMKEEQIKKELKRYHPLKIQRQTKSYESGERRLHVTVYDNGFNPITFDMQTETDEGVLPVRLKRKSYPDGEIVTENGSPVYEYYTVEDEVSDRLCGKEDELA